MLENFLPEEKYCDEVAHLQKNGAYEIKIESTKFAGTTLTVRITYDHSILCQI